MSSSTSAAVLFGLWITITSAVVRLSSGAELCRIQAETSHRPPFCIWIFDTALFYFVWHHYPLSFPSQLLKQPPDGSCILIPKIFLETCLIKFLQIYAFLKHRKPHKSTNQKYLVQHISNTQLHYLQIHFFLGMQTNNKSTYSAR